MVKRVMTPETPEEAKYYTCCYPYPNNTDLEETTDYITFARWIGIILGNTDSLHAIYNKRKACGKVIFAVDKKFPRPERLLGEHRWSEFLKKTDEKEAELKSQIFYCTYDTDRELQKDGWNCISVENVFADFGIDKWFTKVPYPAPHWCQQPLENPTEKPLCRRLPNAQVPRPQPSAPPRRPVVGSSDWSQMRDNSDKANDIGRGNARSNISPQKPAPGAAKRTATQRANTAPNPSSFPPLSSAPPGKKAQPLSLAMNNGSIWDNKPSSVASAVAMPSPLSAPPTSTAHTVWSVKHAKSRAGNASPSTPSSAKRASAPTPQPKSAAAANNVNNKGENLDRTRRDHNKTPAPSSAGKSWGSRSSSSSSARSGGSTTASAASSAPSSPSLPARDLPNFDANAYDYDEEITHDESWETVSTFTPSEPPAPAVRFGDSKAKGKKGREYSHPFVEAVEQEITRPTEQTDLWVHVEPVMRSTGRVTAAEAKAKRENELLCPIHRGRCSNGICEAYKEMQRVRMKQDKKAKKEEEKRKKEREKKNDDEEDDGDTKIEWKEKDGDMRNDGGAKINGDATNDGDMKDEGKKDHADENVTPADKEDNKQVKEDIGKSSNREDQAKSKPWDEYGTSDDDEDYYNDIPKFPSRSSGRKFYDDDEYFD